MAAALAAAGLAQPHAGPFLPRLPPPPLLTSRAALLPPRTLFEDRPPALKREFSGQLAPSFRPLRDGSSSRRRRRLTPPRVMDPSFFSRRFYQGPGGGVIGRMGTYLKSLNPLSKEFVPSLTNILILTNVFFYLLQQIVPGFQHLGMRNSAAIAHGDWHRLFTPIFLHGGFLHILVNTFTLATQGPIIQRLFGNIRFLVIYLAAGWAGNVNGFLNDPRHANSLGASGALFGLLGAMLVYANREKASPIIPSFISQSSIWISLALNVFLGMRPGSNFDNFAHFGGLIGGAIVAWAVAPNEPPPYIPEKPKEEKGKNKRKKTAKSRERAKQLKKMERKISRKYGSVAHATKILDRPNMPPLLIFGLFVWLMWATGESIASLFARTVFGSAYYMYR